MKFEVKSLKCEMQEGRNVSIFTLHLSNFLLAAMIKKNFVELGV